MAAVEKAKKKLPPLFDILDKALAKSKYLTGDHFNLADLNMASVVILTDAIQMDISQYKNIQMWLKNCKDRPAYEKFVNLKK